MKVLIACLLVVVMQKEFNIPNESLKKNIVRIAGLRWKDFKSRLVRDFIHKKHPKYNSPTELYDYLNEEQWDKFVENHKTEEFKVNLIIMFD